MYSVLTQREVAEGLLHYIFWVLFLVEFTHYSKYRKFSLLVWPLMLSLHDSRVMIWKLCLIAYDLFHFSARCSRIKCVWISHRWLFRSTFSPWVYLLSLKRPLCPSSSASNLGRDLHKSSTFPLFLLPSSNLILAARGGGAGHSQGVWCYGVPRKPCAAGPVQTARADQCPSASLGSPATPPVWRKQV